MERPCGAARHPERCAAPGPAAARGASDMEKSSSSEESSLRRSPSLDSSKEDPAEKPSASGRPSGRGFTAGAFYGSSARPTGEKSARRGGGPGSKYVVFYLDLSFVFLLEFRRCGMARGCLCCLKYLMFLFNLLFWVSTAVATPSRLPLPARPSPTCPAALRASAPTPSLAVEIPCTPPSSPCKER